MYPGCYPGLYSFWGFAPSLPVTSAAMLWDYHFLEISPRLYSLHQLLLQCFGFIILLKLRPVFAHNHGCYCNTRYFLYSWDVLFAATGFRELSRHVRVVPCPSVAMIKNITSVASFGLKFCCFTLNKRFARGKDGLKAQ